MKPADPKVTIISPRDVPEGHVVVVSESPVIVYHVADAVKALATKKDPDA